MAFFKTLALNKSLILFILLYFHSCLFCLCLLNSFAWIKIPMLKSMLKNMFSLNTYGTRTLIFARPVHTTSGMAAFVFSLKPHQYGLTEQPERCGWQ